MPTLPLYVVVAKSNKTPDGPTTARVLSAIIQGGLIPGPETGSSSIIRTCTPHANIGELSEAFMSHVGRQILNKYPDLSSFIKVDSDGYKQTLDIRVTNQDVFLADKSQLFKVLYIRRNTQ